MAIPEIGSMAPFCPFSVRYFLTLGQTSALPAVYHLPVHPFYDLSPPDDDIAFKVGFLLSSSSADVPGDMSKVCISDGRSIWEANQTDNENQSSHHPTEYLSYRDQLQPQFGGTIRGLGSIIALKVILFLIKIKNNFTCRIAP